MSKNYLVSANSFRTETGERVLRPFLESSCSEVGVRFS